MKLRIICAALLILLCAGNFAQQKEMFFVTEQGKNGYVSISKTEISNNEFTIKLKSRWVNDDLKPLIDESSVLILDLNDFQMPAEDFITFKDLRMTNENLIIFQDSLKLKFKIKESYTGGTLDFVFPLSYGEGRTYVLEGGETEKFQFSIPSKLATTINISQENILDLTAPKLTVVSPVFDEEKPIVSDNRLVFVVHAEDMLGVSSVKINNIVAEKVSDSLYTAAVNLKTGNNLLVIRATDKNGNVTREDLIVESTYYEPFEIEDGTYYALIISVNEYEDESIVDLDRPREDAQMLFDALEENYTFKAENITFLKDPTRSDIIVTLDEMSQYVTEKDNLIIFYAGHGYFDETRNLGYWLPSDAIKTNTANWIRNSTIRDYIHGIQSKHTLLIADACFSGAIFKSRALGDTPSAIDKLYTRKSRKAMTSGTLTEVPDESVFIKYLVKRLVENEQDYLTSEKLFTSFKEAVLNNSNNIPQYGTIQGSGDEGGDFIFVKKVEGANDEATDENETE